MYPILHLHAAAHVLRLLAGLPSSTVFDLTTRLSTAPCSWVSVVATVPSRSLRIPQWQPHVGCHNPLCPRPPHRVARLLSSSIQLMSSRRPRSPFDVRSCRSIVADSPCTGMSSATAHHIFDRRQSPSHLQPPPRPVASSTTCCVYRGPSWIVAAARNPSFAAAV